ncbi:MAG: 3-dehydroquinate synthase [Clostridiaceae bacterium]|nr:3-dehydroquinate synthase [Clostridiaceae bacterium]
MKNIKVNIPDKNYEIKIENGCLNKIGEMIKNIYDGKKLFIITDRNLQRIYGELLNNNLKSSGYEVGMHVIEPGETSKSLKELEKIYSSLVHYNITRSDLIITFGGGVVGDLGGFAASTFLRGVPYLQCPTSLLAQVDSSVGGKVAIDLESGKNLVGSFYHPVAVFIDPELLKTLPKTFLHDGMAETIKYGAFKDEELFNKLFNFNSDEDLLNNIEEIIYTCCDIKRNIVERDEKDLGERMILNFGHTIGHGIEQYFNYTKYTHGEGVAIGMYWITSKSEQLGITEKGSANKIKEILIKYELPWSVDNLTSNDIIDIISRDKKKSRNNISLILLKSIGNAFIKEIDFNNIKEYI